MAIYKRIMPGNLYYYNNNVFEKLKAKTIVLSKKISSFIYYLNKTNYKGTKYKT
jgi:hypothetical protein